MLITIVLPVVRDISKEGSTSYMPRVYLNTDIVHFKYLV